jgi:hypothetical protein
LDNTNYTEADKAQIAHEAALRRKAENAKHPFEASFNREELEAKYGRVWDNLQAHGEFLFQKNDPSNDISRVIKEEKDGIRRGFASVQRKIDGATGRIEMQANPRFFFNFELF